jgi:hypothetical protein
LKAWADVWRYASDTTLILRYKIGGRTWHEGLIPGRERFLVEKLLNPKMPSWTLSVARWRDFRELAVAARRGEVSLVPVRRSHRGPLSSVYRGTYITRGIWREGPLTKASVVRIEFEYPLPARGETRRCQGGWNARTLTATGCENIAIGRFKRTGKDLRGHFEWLCPSCAGGRSAR